MITNPKTLIGIGLMSGTSLDGLDIVACKYDFDHQNGYKYELLQAQTLAWPSGFQERLHNVYGGSAFDLAQLDHELGKYMGNQVRTFCLAHGLNPDFVASHGHTIFHRPDLGFSVQIGNGAQLSARCGLKVISDFRSGDTGLGGQGAPLVPIGDLLLFAGHNLWLNLGGIANITHRIGDKNQNNTVAFDIGPCCQVLNKLAGLSGLSYDKDGLLARSGLPIMALVDTLDQLDFYAQPSPKSLGREWVDQVFWPILVPYLDNHNLADLLSSVSFHIATQIGQVVLESGLEGNMLISGGGAYNIFLVECIKKTSGTDVNIVLPDAQTIAFKEAIIFGFLGFLRLQNKPNCLARITGASRDSIAGAIYQV